jgi:hypothetical protein
MAIWKLWAEPVPGFVGWGFIGTGLITWVASLIFLRPGLFSGLCTFEATCLTLAGVPAVLLSELFKWWRGW